MSYRLYYRNRSETLWTLIAEIPAGGALKKTLCHEDFGDGIYEFAVCVINTKGLSSPLHASTDQNAEPFGGWYLFWIGNS